MISQEARRNRPEPRSPDEVYGIGEEIEYVGKNYVVPL